MIIVILVTSDTDKNNIIMLPIDVTLVGILQDVKPDEAKA